jgi:Putative restriction endonuclease
MKRDALFRTLHGPFHVDQIRDGDPYELSNGHAIRCMPTGGRGSEAAATAAAVLKSDPEVDSAGVETGYAPSPDTLRAPDVAVGNVPKEPGWVQGAPPLAVEYADTGQDEADLAVKIRELLDAGTRFVWVVRLTGPRRVEVHESGKKKRLVRPGEELHAPGILRNPVPLEALYDWQVGQEVTLRNLLQRHGYEDLEAVRTAGEIEGLKRSILEVFAARDVPVDGAVRTAIGGCQDAVVLTRWLRRAVTAAGAAEILADPL